MSEKIVTHKEGPFSSDKNGKTIYMAKMLMDAGDDETVIYIDGDPLNNRKSNLKVVKSSTLLGISPPGNTIKERMERYRITAEQVYTVLGLSAAEFEKLLVGEVEITKEMASLLGVLLGGNTMFWQSLEEKYRESRL